MARIDELTDILNRGREAHTRGDIVTAEANYKTVLAELPEQPDVLQLLGLVYFARSEFARARDEFVKSLKSRADHPKTLMYLGVSLFQLEDTAKALELLEKAALLQSQDPDIHYNLGVVLQNTGNKQRAREHYEKEISLRPAQAQSCANLAMLLSESGAHEAAIPLYEQALQRDPRAVALWNALGISRQIMKDRGGARSCFEIALRLNPGDVDAVFNTANIECEDERFPEAIALYRNLAGRIDNERYYLFYARALLAEGKKDDFFRIIDEGLKKYPRSLSLTLENTLALPRTYATQKEVSQWRERFIAGLDEVIGKYESGIWPDEDVLAALDGRQNFLLAYQGQIDVDLQKKYYGWHARVAASKVLPSSGGHALRGKKKIRVAYISPNFIEHSVTHTTIGYLKYHDTQKFEITTYFLGDKPDEATELFKKYSDHFHHLPKNVDIIAAQVAQDEIDILFLGDIGMSGIMSALAARRLAPIQCTTQGHPVTSGSPHLDYYVSSEWMEPEKAQEHYSEKLVLLKETGVAYPVPNVRASGKSRADFGIPEKAFVYISSQSLFKYLPENDGFYTRILALVPGSVLVFLSGRYDSEKRIFSERMRQACIDQGVDPLRVKILPRVKRADFMALHREADVFLDSMPWSAENTLFEAWHACDLPVVTFPGPMMRHRHALAILKQAGVEECIAQSPQEFIKLAVRLGEDVSFYEIIRKKISAGKSSVYEDRRVGPDLESHFMDWIQQKIRMSTKTE